MKAENTAGLMADMLKAENALTAKHLTFWMTAIMIAVFGALVAIRFVPLAA